MKYLIGPRGVCELSSIPSRPAPLRSAPPRPRIETPFAFPVGENEMEIFQNFDLINS